MTAHEDPMAVLFLADPETAAQVQEKLSGRLPPVTVEELGRIVEETLWALTQETALGQAYAAGLVALSGRTAADHLEIYRAKVRETGARNAAIGKMMAIHLVPVLKTGDARLIEQFIDTTGKLLKIGAYTLAGPFEALTYLLESQDMESSLCFLDLLGSVLSPDLSYNRCKHLCHILPKAVQSFSPSRRLFQIHQLIRVARADPGLVEGFLDGLQRGACLLAGHALHRFVSEGLTRSHRNRAAGTRFLSLESQQALELLDKLQTAVSFSQIQHGMNRYLQARTGCALSVRPLSELSETDDFTPEPPLSCSCGSRLFLPDEISRFDGKPENLLLYNCLTRLEACYHEFGTYGFDLEMAIDACKDADDSREQGPGDRNRMRQLRSQVSRSSDSRGEDTTASDMRLFCRIFSNPGLAADLMTIFEHGRIRILLAQHYPGILRQSLPVLTREAARIYGKYLPKHPLQALYVRIALGIRDPEKHGLPDAGTAWLASVLQAVDRHFCRIISGNAGVEDCAVLVWKSYQSIEACLTAAALNSGYRLNTPFGRGLRPDLALDRLVEVRADLIKSRLAEKGVRVYKSRIRKLLTLHTGPISKDELLNLIQSSADVAPAETDPGNAIFRLDLPDLDLSDIPGLLDTADIQDALSASWYREWDSRHGDYLHHHVRVVDRTVEGTSAGFYEQTLERHRELVSQIRHAFEMMKPQGLKLLRNWTEGDELDYRALLDFVLDQKAGLMPSDRLYIKRIKQERNVAVLLLVDLSRSTGNAVSNGPSDAGATVLDIEKEAIVLFCEALGILGDTFAIAGFSGNGRLSVDYTHIKEFDEPLNDAVRRRIGGLTPQRSTRMGAAIRHATALFDQVPASVRLMIVLGDGFPNDVDYKQEYAVADTRKAIGEALYRRIRTHAITVNMQNDPRLDDLYGSVHHNVISDVRELPARLLRIYGALTRGRPGAS